MVSNIVWRHHLAGYTWRTNKSSIGFYIEKRRKNKDYGQIAGQYLHICREALSWRDSKKHKCIRIWNYWQNPAMCQTALKKTQTAV